jgi:hypothetical protein
MAVVLKEVGVAMKMGAEEFACSAVETLLVLEKHQSSCRQCQIDEDFCMTAQSYQQGFMADVRRYERAFGHSSARLVS